MATSTTHPARSVHNTAIVAVMANLVSAASCALSIATHAHHSERVLGPLFGTADTACFACSRSLQSACSRSTSACHRTLLRLSRASSSRRSASSMTAAYGQATATAAPARLAGGMGARAARGRARSGPDGGLDQRCMNNLAGACQRTCARVGAAQAVTSQSALSAMSGRPGRVHGTCARAPRRSGSVYGHAGEV